MNENEILGCIYAGAIGDGMGSAYEGMSDVREIDIEKPWKQTDDTQLTLATCESISQEGYANPEKIAESFLFWFCQKRIHGIGGSTLKALNDLSAGGHWALVGRKGEYSAGNGAAMRIAPLYFCLDPMDVKDKQIIRDVCRITHHNDEAYVGSLSVLLAMKLIEKDDEFNLIEEIIEIIPDSRVRDRFIEINTTDELSIENYSKHFDTSGYVVDSVPFSIYASQSLANNDIQEILMAIIRQGGDTDTNASIAGQICGLKIGLSNIPDTLTEKIPKKESLKEITSEFCKYIQKRAR